jgi:hypothetical protein
MDSLQIHPKCLENLGKLTAQQAFRYLKYFPIGFNRVEIANLVELAGCKDSDESWTPYRENVIPSPFLIY